MSKHNKRGSEITSVLSSIDTAPQELIVTETSDRFSSLKADWKKKLLYPLAGVTLIVFIGIGVMAKNGWLPSTDAMTGKKTGWFGKDLPNNASSSWNPLSNPLPTPTPQLSKEYIYAGSRMLAVGDANASASPPGDIAVWRPSSGVWWVMSGQGSQQVGVQWGSGGNGSTIPSDIPVQGDYDGDGLTDFSVYRPGTRDPNYPNTPAQSMWYIIRSSTGGLGTSYGFGYGLDTDKTAAADYDGDGLTNPAIFRPSTGVWYVMKADTTTVGYSWGQNGDIPMPADYDGDGLADLAVWQSNASYYIKRSSDGVSVTQQFTGATEAVPADYDGDGKADMAVRSGTNWIIKRSSDNQTETVSWQQSGDKAVVNDYDGDGKVDIAVWRPSNGNWYIRQSSRVGQTNELRNVQWGQTGDIPVPALYRR